MKTIRFDNSFVEKGNIHFGLKRESGILTIETSLKEPLDIGDVMHFTNPLTATDGTRAAFEVVKIISQRDSPNPNKVDNVVQKTELKIISSKA